MAKLCYSTEIEFIIEIYIALGIQNTPLTLGSQRTKMQISNC